MGYHNDGIENFRTFENKSLRLIFWDTFSLRGLFLEEMTVTCQRNMKRASQLFTLPSSLLMVIT